MRRRMIALALCAPVASYAATHTIGVDVGRGSTADLDCPSSQIPACAHEDDSFRVYYSFRPAERFGVRITRTWINELRLTTEVDPIFNDPGISTVIHDLSATYSYPIAKRVSITARGGISRWEENRSFSLLGQDQTTGYSPAFGLNIDFGDKLVRAGLSVDLYPSVGDTGYLRHYGVGIRFVW
jgi:hypothetical protein